MSEPVRFELNYTLGPIEAASACLLMYLKPFRLIRWFVLGVVAFSVFYLGDLLFSLGWERSIQALAAGAYFRSVQSILLTLLGLVLALPLFFALYSFIYVLAKRRSGQFRYQLIVSDADFLGVTPKATTRYNWNAFDSIFVFGNLAYARFPAGSCILLPRRALTNSGEWKDMLAFVASKIASTSRD